MRLPVGERDLDPPVGLPLEVVDAVVFASLAGPGFHRVGGR
jgi:hypothetical protein